jgi:type I restriction enzyme S subunit
LPKQDRQEGQYPVVSSSGIIDRHFAGPIKSPGITVGRSGSVGSLFYVEEDFWPLNTTLFVKKLFGNNAKFIYYLLNSIDLIAHATGAGVPTLNRNIIHEIYVNINLNISEQQRIVSILDAAFADIATARANAEKNLVNAKELFEAELDNIFNELYSNNELVTVDRVCDSIIDCVNKTAPTVDYETPYRMIRTTNVKNGIIDIEKTKYVTKDVYDIWIRRQRPEKGDIILTREAPIGEVGILNDDGFVFLGQRLVSYRVNNKKLYNRYLLYTFLSSMIQEQIIKKASGSTVLHMRVPDSIKLKLPVPNISSQQHIVARLDELSDNCKKLEAIYTQKIALYDDLKQSLLQRAFSGEL